MNASFANRLAPLLLWVTLATAPALAQEPADGSGAAAGTGSGQALVPGAAGLDAAPPGVPDAPPPAVPERVDLSTFSAQIAAPDGPLTVGDRFDLTIQVDLPAGVALSGVDAVNIGRLELLDSHIQPAPAPAPDRQAATATVALVTYRAGTHTIEGFDLVVVQPDGATERLRVPGLDVSVQSVIANEQDPQLRPEKDGVPVRYRDYTLAWVGGIGAGVLLLSAIVFMLARNRPRAIKLPPPLPPRPAHEVAIEKLDAIKQDGLIASGQTMAFHVRLSETVREYLGLRYGFNGLDLTTTELLAQLDQRRLPPSFGREAIGHQLYACDLVKFAKEEADAAAEEELLDGAYRLVRETTPRPAPPEAAPPTSFRPEPPSGSPRTGARP